MYESPIKVIQDKIKYEYEENILKAVQNVGIEVDKDELIKALKYDREQYVKGYRDAVTTMLRELGDMLAEV